MFVKIFTYQIFGLSRITGRAHAYDPSTQEAEAGSPPKFKDNLGEETKRDRETNKQTNKMNPIHLKFLGKRINLKREAGSSL